MPETIVDELLTLSSQLLESIDRQDWSRYCELCDESLTAFEPEAVGHLVSGMPFHEFYFTREPSGLKVQSTISSPNVRIMDHTAIVTYIRLTQRAEEDGGSSTIACEETRVWHLQQESWKHVHFHRSRVG